MAKLRSRGSPPLMAKPRLKQLTSRRDGVDRTTPKMHNFLRSLQSDSITKTPEENPFPFIIRRGYEGVQLVLNWNTPPLICSEIRILRAMDRWPENVNDGKLIVSDSYPFSVFTHADLTVGAYNVYYYVLFAKRTADGAWVAPHGYRGKEFPLPTGYFKGKLWDLLPAIYHQVDGEM